MAVGLVFLHTAVIFGAGEFPVKAPTEHLAVTVVLAFGGMPLLFLISGTGARYSLRSRTPGTFTRERLRRLGVPLLAGLLTLIPLQVYLGQRRSGDAGSFVAFLARLWDVRPSLDFPFLVEAFRRHWRPAAVAGLLAFLAGGATHLLAGPGTDPLTAMDPASLGLRLLKSLAVRRNGVVRLLFGLRPR